MTWRSDYEPIGVHSNRNIKNHPKKKRLLKTRRQQLIDEIRSFMNKQDEIYEAKKKKWRKKRMDDKKFEELKLSTRLFSKNKVKKTKLEELVEELTKLEKLQELNKKAQKEKFISTATKDLEKFVKETDFKHDKIRRLAQADLMVNYKRFDRKELFEQVMNLEKKHKATVEKLLEENFEFVLEQSLKKSPKKQKKIVSFNKLLSPAQESKFRSADLGRMLSRAKSLPKARKLSRRKSSILNSIPAIGASRNSKLALNTFMNSEKMQHRKSINELYRETAEDKRRRRLSKDPRVLMNLHKQVKRNEIKIKIIEIFNEGINHTRSYPFVIKKVGEYLKHRGAELKDIWKFVPKKAKNILAKDLIKRTLKYNEFMREKFLRYLKTVLDKAERLKFKPKDEEVVDELPEENHTALELIEKHKKLTEKFRSIDNSLVQRMDKFKKLEADKHFEIDKKIVKKAIKAVKTNNVEEINSLLTYFPELIEYKDCVSNLIIYWKFRSTKICCTTQLNFRMLRCLMLC
jgi:hypothetical protein